MDVPEDLLPYDEAAQRAGVSISTLRRAIREGRLRRWRRWGDRRALVSAAEVDRLRRPRSDRGAATASATVSDHTEAAADSR